MLRAAFRGLLRNASSSQKDGQRSPAGKSPLSISPFRPPVLSVAFTASVGEAYPKRRDAKFPVRREKRRSSRAPLGEGGEFYFIRLWSMSAPVASQVIYGTYSIIIMALDVVLRVGEQGKCVRRQLDL